MENLLCFLRMVLSCSRKLKVSPFVFPVALYRDIASAIKELLDTVNNVIKKYQYQNRRVSHKHALHLSFFILFCKFCSCFLCMSQTLICVFVCVGSGAPEKGVCEVLQKFQRHPENILQRRKVSATVDAAPQFRIIVTDLFIPSGKTCCVTSPLSRWEANKIKGDLK